DGCNGGGSGVTKWLRWWGNRVAAGGCGDGIVVGVTVVVWQECDEMVVVLCGCWRQPVGEGECSGGGAWTGGSGGDVVVSLVFPGGDEGSGVGGYGGGDEDNDEFLKTIDENMQKIIKEQTSYDVAADLSEMELKKILIKKMEGNKSIHRSNEQRNLYKALVKAYESDNIILDTWRHSHVEETVADDQPIVEPSQHPEWFFQQKKPPTPDRDWNKTLPATHRSIQPWISEQAKQSDSRSSFNELMDTLVEFSNFLMNRLNVDTLTPELLAGPTYELMKGSCKSLGISHWGCKRQQFYGFAVKRESARDVYSKRRIIAVTELKIIEWHNYKHLDWITVRRDDDKLYKFKQGDFKRLRIQDIEDIIVIQRRVEDLQLSVESYQKKLNLTKPKTYRSDLKRKDAYILYSNPRGFIYQNKDKQKMLMRIDELHKFSDGTLTDVRTALDDHLKGIRMKYLPQSIWRKSDKDRAAALIQAIDKRLKTRRIMRSLERFVGGRLYEGDFRMLQRTV
nr:hypothetical protein [Tanacetum cinerariifolium]GEY10958.1 hypothetical protein [Tanacetum cinerariifolium]